MRKPPARMQLEKLQDQKPECHLEWPYQCQVHQLAQVLCFKFLSVAENMTGGVRPDYRLISKTSRFYIGLAVGLPVFSKISLILTHVQTVLSLQGKATSRN